MSRRTLFLNVDKWDLTLTSSGDIAVATEDYATAQDVSNAVRLFRNDAYLAWDEGIPHFAIDLGIVPSAAAVRSRYRSASLAVENVREAAVEIDGIADRLMTGTIRITTENGIQANIGI